MIKYSVVKGGLMRKGIVISTLLHSILFVVFINQNQNIIFRKNNNYKIDLIKIKNEKRIVVKPKAEEPKKIEKKKDTDKRNKSVQKIAKSDKKEEENLVVVKKEESLKKTAVESPKEKVPLEVKGIKIDDSLEKIDKKDPEKNLVKEKVLERPSTEAEEAKENITKLEKKKESIIEDKKPLDLSENREGEGEKETEFSEDIREKSGNDISIKENLEGITLSFISKEQPKYPEIYKKIRLRRAVAVEISILVGIDGRVEEIQYKNKVPEEFQVEVEKAVYSWELQPVICDGENVKLRLQERFIFK